MNNTKLKELFVPCNESFELKNLGFNETCFTSYNARKEFVGVFDTALQEGVTVEDCFVKNTKIHPEFATAPTYSQTFKFFRDKYNWQHCIKPTADQNRFELGYNYWIWNSKTGEEYDSEPKNRPTGDWEYETYFEAELECLKKLIKIVKNDFNTRR